MNRQFLILLVLLIVFSTASAEIIHDNFYSASLLENRAVDIYLPPDYQASSESYPVIYFLHGMSSSPGDYSPMLNTLLDGLIPGGLIDPIIVALPDGNTDFYAGSMYTNSDFYGLFENYIAADVIQYVEANYRALVGREQRAIMGHSMGGYGAMKIAVKHADQFYGVVSLSGFLSVYPFAYWQTQILTENGGHAPYTYNIDNGWFTLAAVTTAAAFTPNLDNPPYSVDFPLNANGDVVSVVRDLWFQNMPGYLSRQHANVNTLAIYFDCGMQDELGFYPMNEYFSAQLDSQDIAYRFDSFNGTHSSQLIARGMLGFMYLDSVRNTLTAKPAPLALPSEFSLLQNYPNPFNSFTRIEFMLSRAGYTELSVFDILSRQTTQLVNDVLPAGEHVVNFNANNMPSGVYLCRLTSGGEMQVRKMVLMR
jgi:enterochelin esterase-like enzyme